MFGVGRSWFLHFLPAVEDLDALRRAGARGRETIGVGKLKALESSHCFEPRL